MLNGISDNARSWMMVSALVAASFAAGAGFVGWLDMPDRLKAQDQAITILASNQMTLAEQLAVVRCRLDELSSYECNQLQQRYRDLLSNPDKSISNSTGEKGGR